MQQDKDMREITFRLIKGTVILMFLCGALILKGTGITVIAYGAQKEQNADNMSRNSIYFENSRVEAGVPLKVKKAPENSVYLWVITGADGKKKSFTTTKNSYTPTKADTEKLITVSIDTLGQDTASIYFSSLPVIYIDNSNGYHGIGDDYSAAEMKLQGSKTVTDKSELYNGNISIKLRGNSTRLREKRPFNIKLDKKTDLLGMGKNKHWALLANDIDHTLMRNKLLYDFSGEIGMDTYMKSENVVVIFNNEYEGVYQLCELVDTGSHRVAVYDWEDAAESASEAIVNQVGKEGIYSKHSLDKTEKKLEDAMCRDLSWITSPYTFTYDADGDGKEETYRITDYIKLPAATGGVLMEMDFFAFQGKNASPMFSSYSQPWYFKAPEYAITDTSLYQNINKYVQSFEYSLHSTDFIYHDNSVKYQAVNRSGGSQNPGYVRSRFTAPEYDGKHYSELFDMDSLVQNFIVCEYAMNWDGMKNSVFMYKDIDGLFHMGPVWDFDWAWGNINMYQKNTWYPKDWNTTNDIFAREQYYQTVQWNRYLIRDPYFLVRVYEKYKEIRENAIENMIKDGGTIDTYARALKKPATANDAKWSYTYAGYKSVGFDESVKNMKTFIHTRIDWLDQQFKSLDTLMNSLGYYKPDASLKVTKIAARSGKDDTVITAKVTDSDISSLVFQVNGTKLYTVKVKSGKAVCQVASSVLVKDRNVLNVVEILACDSDGNYIIDSEDKGNYSMAKSNYAVFYTGKKYSDNIKIYYIVTIAFVIVIMCSLLIAVIRYRRRSFQATDKKL